MTINSTGMAEGLAESYLNFIREKDFPCLGAKAALAKENVFVLTANHLDSADDDGRIIDFLYTFVDRIRNNQALYQSAAILFDSPEIMNDTQFSVLFWQRLQALSNLDAKQYSYDPSVSMNPHDADFSYSLKGEAFYVIGLHPGSSRRARQFSKPAIIFNPHAQFGELKRMNKYEGMKRAIRNRDIKYSGSVNPMLADFGESSEVFQYSGAQHTSTWKCPFIAHHDKHHNDSAT